MPISEILFICEHELDMKTRMIINMTWTWTYSRHAHNFGHGQGNLSDQQIML
jgi:hypothetical protein